MTYLINYDHYFDLNKRKSGAGIFGNCYVSKIVVAYLVMEKMRVESGSFVQRTGVGFFLSDD